MEQDFLVEKAEWMAKMKWGDMAEAARIAGVKRSTFQEWMLAVDVKDYETANRNLKAIKEAVRKREKHLAEAIAA